MVAKTGRPKKENPKGEQYRLRMTGVEQEKLEFCAKATGMTKAEVLLKGIDLIYEQVTKK